MIWSTEVSAKLDDVALAGLGSRTADGEIGFELRII